MQHLPEDSKKSYTPLVHQKIILNRFRILNIPVHIPSSLFQFKEIIRRGSANNYPQLLGVQQLNHVSFNHSPEALLKGVELLVDGDV